MAKPMTKKLRDIARLDKELVLSPADQAEEWQDSLYIGDEESLPDRQLSLAAKLPWFFYGLLVLAALLIFWRVYEVQFSRASYYKNLGQDNHTRLFYERAMRGLIYDREGRALVENIPRDDVAIVPADFPRVQERRQALLAELGQLLKLDPETIRTQLQEFAYVFQPVVVKENIDHEIMLALKSGYDGKDGIMVLANYERRYPWGASLAPVLGYVGKISEEELSQNGGIYHRQSYLGKTGVEAGGEAVLRGQDRERRLLVNAQGQLTQDQSAAKVIAGANIALTIDATLQGQVRQELAAGLRRAGAASGAAIVLDPNNGEILSLVSLPDYDNNLFARGINDESSVKKYQALLADPARPLLNRAVAGLYPPGSVFKLVAATGVLAENVVGPKDKINAPGQIMLEHGFDENVEFVFPDWKVAGHGQLNITMALAESADTYFYQTVGGYKGLVGLGIERLADYAAKLGVGRKFGVEVPGENPGVFPGDEWKRQRLGERWYQGDTYHVAIGQGYLLVNPLQVAVFTAAVANGGTVYRPHLIKSVVTEVGERQDVTPQVLEDDIAPAWVFERVREGMLAAVMTPTGTAKALRGLSVTAAGKTGTAQYSNNEKEHAWFTAFAPYRQPEVVVTVLVEGGGEGGEAALPVARQILADYFERR